MSSALELVGAAVAAAKARGLDQAGLASAAGLRAETLSRAKSRGTLDLASLQKLASAVGLELRLLPVDVAAPVKAPSQVRSTLAQPKWGLAWSNPNMSDDALVRAALKHGGFQVVLQAVDELGLAFVKQQLAALKDDMTSRARSEVQRQLTNIEVGRARVEG